MGFEIGGKVINNRLFVGTGKLPDYSLIKRMYEDLKIEVFVVAVRRINPEKDKGYSVLDFIPKGATIMINTSGARNHKEAVKIAFIGREITGSDWIKIEISGELKYLLPDNEETIRTAEILVKEGFKVFPYISPDLITAKKLEDIGVCAVMPLGSPIGSNRGIDSEILIKAIINEISVPVIIDAGLGRPSHAAKAMELGADAVLINTAIATSKDPINMAKAFNYAVKAGRLAYEIGLPEEREFANASSPLADFIKSID
jgi:thiazole synthase